MATGDDAQLSDLFQTIRRGSLQTFGIQVAGGGLGYLLEIFLARVLGADQYGEYSWVVAWVYLLAVLASLGLSKATIRFVPEYAANRRWGLLKGAVLRSWHLILLAGLGVVCLGLAGVYLAEYMADFRLTTAILVGFVLVIPRALLDLQSGLSRGLKRMVLAYVPTSILRPLLVMVAVGILVVATDITVTSSEALWITVAVFTLLVVGQGYRIWKALPDAARDVSAEYRTRHWLRVSVPLLLAAASFMLLGKTDIIMLGIFSDSTNVGIYNAASRTAQLAGYVVMALNSIAAPMYSELYTKGERLLLQQLAARVSTWMFWPSLAIGLGMVVFSEPIMKLFGETFVTADLVLTILVGAYVLSAGIGSVAYLLDMTGHQDHTARIVGLTALLNVGLNAIAIPLLGATGAALATAISMSTWNLALRHVVVRKLNIEPSILHVARSAFK